jgi:hypothetical protein
MLEHRFALLLAAALSVAGVDGACWDYGEDDCQVDLEDGSLCEWVDSWYSCQNACSEATADWLCDGNYCSWSYEDGVCERSCSLRSEDACDAEPMCEFIDLWDSCATAC